MHTMEKTPKTVTIIGLILEGLGIFGVFTSAVIFLKVFTVEFFENFVPAEEMGDLDQIIEIYNFIGNLMIYLGIFLLIIFVVDLFLFVKLIKGNYNEQQASKVYTYQFIIGVVMIVLNTITGILYIVSGIQGKNKQPDKLKTREGL